MIRLDKERAWETFKLTFCIIGAAGFTGYVESMSIFFRIVALITVLGLLSGIYSMTSKENELGNSNQNDSASNPSISSSTTRRVEKREVQPFSEREWNGMFFSQQENETNP